MIPRFLIVTACATAVVVSALGAQQPIAPQEPTFREMGSDPIFVSTSRSSPPRSQRAADGRAMSDCGKPRGTRREPLDGMRNERPVREQAMETKAAGLHPCATCGKPAFATHDGVPVCRDCAEASRPHHDGDPYDDLGGSKGGD